MAKKRTPAKPSTKRPAAKKSPAKSKPAGKRPQVVFNGWDSYVMQAGDEIMFVSFDNLVTRGKPPAGLALCARVLVPIQAPNDAGGPVSPEAERLWDMEDELCRLLRKHGVRCRLVARLTHCGVREIVFQLHDWKSFRPPVGLWIGKHQDYDIEVSEHKGWKFFDQFVRPSEEDRIFMADRDVIDSLVESGSNPAKKHSLEYSFRGDARGLKRVASTLMKKGYKPLGELDYNSGTIELATKLPLDLTAIVEQSIHNHHLAQKSNVEFAGWGAAVIQ